MAGQSTQGWQGGQACWARGDQPVGTKFWHMCGERSESWQGMCPAETLLTGCSVASRLSTPAIHLHVPPASNPSADPTTHMAVQPK
jgi:hypothetical protein